MRAMSASRIWCQRWLVPMLLLVSSAFADVAPKTVDYQAGNAALQSVLFSDPQMRGKRPASFCFMIAARPPPSPRIGRNSWLDLVITSSVPISSGEA